MVLNNQWIAEETKWDGAPLEFGGKESTCWAFLVSQGQRIHLQCKNLPANAGDMGLIPGLGRSHMLQSNLALPAKLLSLCSGA